MPEETRSFVPDQLDAIAELSAAAVPEILEVFLRSCQDRVSALCVALDAEDWGQVSALAHSLKGSGACVGAVALSEIAGALEKHANGHEPTMTPDMEAHRAALKPEFERARAGAEAYTQSMNL